MKYQSAILSDVKEKNRKSFWSVTIVTLIVCVIMTAVLMWQDPEHMILVGTVMSVVAFFIIMIWAGILLSGITYTVLKNESNHFDTEKLKLIDADYTTAAVFNNNCRVGKLYVYGYYKAGFVMVPIQRIEYVHTEYQMTKPMGYMVIIRRKDTKIRSMIGAFDHKEDAQQIVNCIAQQNHNIEVK